MQSDAELIELVKTGQVEAYAELVVRYERSVRAAALHTVRERHLADDVTQDVFVAAYRGLHSLRDGSKFGPWLLRIAKNQAARAVRSRCRAPALVGEVDSTVVDESPLSDLSTTLLELVAQLPEYERVIVELKNFQGHSVREIAEITGRPVGTVTKQLSRAYERLRTGYAREKLS